MPSYSWVRTIGSGINGIRPTGNLTDLSARKFPRIWFKTLSLCSEAGELAYKVSYFYSIYCRYVCSFRVSGSLTVSTYANLLYLLIILRWVGWDYYSIEHSEFSKNGEQPLQVAPKFLEPSTVPHHGSRK